MVLYKTRAAAPNTIRVPRSYPEWPHVETPTETEIPKQLKIDGKNRQFVVCRMSESTSAVCQLPVNNTTDLRSLTGRLTALERALAEKQRVLRHAAIGSSQWTSFGGAKLMPLWILTPFYLSAVCDTSSQRIRQPREQTGS